MTTMTDATAIPAVLGHHPVARSELWAAWHPDPLIIGGLALTLVLYHHGLARLASRSRRRPSRWAVVAFDCGVAALALALASPLDAAAASIFSAHMVQHLVLLTVAAPLLVCGRPELVLTSALPAGPRRRLRRGAARPVVRRAGTSLSHPIVAWVLATVTLWAWHHPTLYEAAVNHDLVHAAEHVTLLGTAALVWAVALGRVRRRLAVPAAALVLVATALQGSAFGAGLTLARAPLYAVHTAMAPRWGLTPLEDQQLAGALMWVPPGLVYTGVAAALLARWFNTLDARPTVTGTGSITRGIARRGNGSDPRPVGGRTLP
jgi:putative membrane protein